MHGSTRRPGITIAAALGIALAAGSTARNAFAEKPSDTQPPSCLDQSITDELGDRLRPRGVQKRVFLKNKKVVLTPNGGVFAGDLLSSSYIYGVRLAFFFTEDLALEVGFHVTPLALDLDRPLAEFFGDDRFVPGTGYLGMANLAWSPIHAKLKTGGSILHSDVLLLAGAGRLFHDSAQGIAFNAGFAIEIFTTRWVTIRLDLRDVVMVQEAVAETRLTNNLMATFGLSLWIPTGL